MVAAAAVAQEQGWNLHQGCVNLHFNQGHFMPPQACSMGIRHPRGDVCRKTAADVCFGLSHVEAQSGECAQTEDGLLTIARIGGSTDPALQKLCTSLAARFSSIRGMCLQHCLPVLFPNGSGSRPVRPQG